MDCPEVDSIVIDARERSLVERIVRCMAAGEFWSDATVIRDVDGRTYVSATGRVMGRYASANLERLGF